MRGSLRTTFGALFATATGVSTNFNSTTSHADNGTLRTFTRDEVAQGGQGNRFLVIYKDGVYDLTEFRSKHPGGSLIEQGAGSDVEQFWAKWAYHYDSKMVKEVLQDTKIGVLSPEKEGEEGDGRATREESYASEPTRDPLLQKICSTTPYCSETHPEELTKSYITKTDALYVRNHAPVPHLNADTHKVSFSSENPMLEDKNARIQLSLRDLNERFGDEVEVVSVLQCAGNRQTDDFKASGPNGFTGGPYESLQSGMVGNIRWRGYRLDSILRALFPEECREEEEGARNEDVWHVLFTGADEYETSTPLSILLEREADCLVATGMNGGALHPDHGYPLRVVLPGKSQHS